MTKKIAVFGSTGSIGINTLKIIKNNPDFLKVEVLVAYSNVKLLAQQAIALRSSYVCIVDESKLDELKLLLNNTNIVITSGDKGLSEVAKIKVDLTMMAIVGASAILPTIETIKAGNNIALANKECLVCAGNIIMNLVKQYKVQLIPVDSEHNGLFQIFDHNQLKELKHVTLTASGGPFRNYSLEQMKQVTKAQALKHPNWTMGAKITIDSATLVNKCLEVIEAYYLFPIKADQIKIVIHPESIIHAMITYQDGSTLTQLSKPDMQIPISYALHYPNRAILPEFNHFDLTDVENLHFYKPDLEKFKSLKILQSVLSSIDSNSSLVFNVSNEVAVAAFLNDQISFTKITQIIEETLNKIEQKKLSEPEEVFQQIELARQQSKKLINILQ